MGVTHITKEHIGLATVLKIPIIFVISKIDLCPEYIKQQTIEDTRNIIKIAKIKSDKLIQNEDDLMACIKILKTGSSTAVAPIFQLSSVTGRGYDLLRKFLNLMPSRLSWSSLLNQPTTITIDQDYSITGVGTVATGTVLSGTVTEGQTLLLGPNDIGLFQPVSIKSIQTKRVPVRELAAGGSGGFALKKNKAS
jgi:GTPase